MELSQENETIENAESIPIMETPNQLENQYQQYMEDRDYEFSLQNPLGIDSKTGKLTDIETSYSVRNELF